MVRNTTGGNKQKGKKRSTANQKRIIEYADGSTSLYGLVISPLGDCKFLVHCNDNIDRIGVIRGSLYKNTFITPGDLVLITLREFEQVKPLSKERCDIVIKYQAGEIEQLRRKKVFYTNSTNTFNLTLDKGLGKKSKDNVHNNEQISFDHNVKAQKTLGELPDIDDEETKTEEKEELTNDISESSNDEDEDEDEDEDNDEDNDEYGNNKKYIKDKLSSKSSNEEEQEHQEQEEQEKPIPQFKNKRGVYVDDDDFM